MFYKYFIEFSLVFFGARGNSTDVSYVLPIGNSPTRGEDYLRDEEGNRQFLVLTRCASYVQGNSPSRRGSLLDECGVAHNAGGWCPALRLNATGLCPEASRDPLYMNRWTIPEISPSSVACAMGNEKAQTRATCKLLDEG